MVKMLLCEDPMPDEFLYLEIGYWTSDIQSAEKIFNIQYPTPNFQ